MPEPAPLVPAPETARALKDDACVLLDVRESFELARAKVEGALHIPMAQVTGRLDDLPLDRPIHVMCHSGARSQAVADWLRARGYDAHNVAGGIDAWATEVDEGVGRY